MVDIISYCLEIIFGLQSSVVGARVYPRVFYNILVNLQSKFLAYYFLIFILAGQSLPVFLSPCLPAQVCLVSGWVVYCLPSVALLAQAHLVLPDFFCSYLGR